MLGFLSPEGEFYECGYFEHMKLAEKLLREKYNCSSNRPVDKLCRFGWVVLQSSFIGFSGDDAYGTPEFKGRQKTWLEDHRKQMAYDQLIGLDLCLEINDLLYED